MGDAERRNQTRYTDPAPMKPKKGVKRKEPATTSRLSATSSSSSSPSSASEDSDSQKRPTKVAKSTRDSDVRNDQSSARQLQQQLQQRFYENSSPETSSNRESFGTSYNSSYYEESPSTWNPEGAVPRSSGSGQQLHTPRDDEGLAPVVARHYNEIEEKGLEAREESKIVILRKYNNWAKSMNFNDAMDAFRKAGKRFNTLVGLDLCCGKGGDLRKWEKSRMMQHVIFVDIAEVSLTNCRERYEDMRRKHEEQRQRRGGRGPPLFTAEFFVADCTKEVIRTKLSNPDMQFDLVSCQFSFHYCFESLPQVKQMLANVTDNLVSGGYFIGTLPNGDRITKRLRRSNGLEFGNEVYKIRFECCEPFPAYGARYFFELQDAVSCPEFLVHFPTFLRVTRLHNLECIYAHPLDEFHKIHVARNEAKNLLNGMGALEVFPPHQGDQLHFEESNYAHAGNRVEECKQETRGTDRYNHDLRVGTISAVEWEAIGLYLAFCFRKR